MPSGGEIGRFPFHADAEFVAALQVRDAARFSEVDDALARRADHMGARSLPGSDEPVYAQPQQGFADHRARDSELFRQLNLGEQAGALGPFTVGYPLVDALIDRVAERPAGCPLCGWGHKVEFAHWAGHLVRL